MLFFPKKCPFLLFFVLKNAITVLKRLAALHGIVQIKPQIFNYWKSCFPGRKNVFGHLNPGPRVPDVE